MMILQNSYFLVIILVITACAFRVLKHLVTKRPRLLTVLGLILCLIAYPPLSVLLHGQANQQNWVSASYANVFTAVQTFTANVILCGPNPSIDVTCPLYGAKGDGSTNDGAAIQAAEAAAEAIGKGTLFFPCGVYEIGSTALRINTDGIGWRGAHGSPTIKTSAVPCVDIKSSSNISAAAPSILVNAGVGTACAANDTNKVYLDTGSVTGSLSNGTYQIAIAYFDPYSHATDESAMSTALSVTLTGGTATQAIHVCSPDYAGKPKFYRVYDQLTSAPTTSNLDDTASSCIGSSSPHTPPCWIGDQQDITVIGAGTGNAGTGIANSTCMLTIENASGPGTQLKVGPVIENLNFHTSSAGAGCLIHNISASATKLSNVAGVGGSSTTPGLTGFWNGGWIISSAFSDRVVLDTVHMTSPWIAFLEQPQGDMDIRSADVNQPTGTGSCVAGSGVSQDTCPNGLLALGGRVDFQGHMDIGASTTNTGITADANAGFGTAKPVVLGTLTIEHGVLNQTAVQYKNDTNNVLTLMCTITAGTCVHADSTSTGNVTTILKATAAAIDYLDDTGTPTQNTWVLPGYTKNQQSATVTGADWTCGTGGTQSTCVTAKTISNFSFALPRVGTWTVTCDLIVGQATAVTANSWNLQTATNAPTNLSGSYSMYTAASALLTGVVGPVAATTTQAMAPTWTLGAIGTKMTAHLAGTVEVTSALGTTLNIQLAAPTVADLVTIFRGSSCQVY